MTSSEIPDDDALRAILAAVESLLPSADRWEPAGSYDAVGLAIIDAVWSTSEGLPFAAIAAGAAAQNIILASHALGFGAFWRTGAPAYDSEVKSALGLAEHDALIGFLYIGTIVVPGKSKTPEIDSVTRRW